MNKNDIKAFLKILLRLIVAVFILVVSQVLSQSLIALMNIIEAPVVFSQAIGAIAYVVFTLMFSKLWIEKALKGELNDYKIKPFKIDRKSLLIALLLPLLITFFYICLPGEWQRGAMSSGENVNWLSNGILYVGFAAGFVEEIIFRGVMMRSIEEIGGSKLAIWLPSLLFGWVHTIGLPFHLMEYLLVITAGTSVGIMFSYIALYRNSIWDSGIVHGLWNIIIIGNIVHVGTSADPYSLYSYLLSSKKLMITGGQFGIESSMIAIAAYLLVIFFVKRQSGKNNGKRKQFKKHLNRS